MLFPLLISIAVNSTLDPSRLRRYLFISFAVCALGLYVARGILLIAFLQMFFLFSLRSRVGAKKQYLLALGAFAIAIAGMTIIGNLRTAHDIFIISFRSARGTPIGRWPFSGSSHIFLSLSPISVGWWRMDRLIGQSFAFLYSLLPSFMAPSDPVRRCLREHEHRR